MNKYQKGLLILNIMICIGFICIFFIFMPVKKYNKELENGIIQRIQTLQNSQNKHMVEEVMIDARHLSKLHEEAFEDVSYGLISVFLLSLFNIILIIRGRCTTVALPPHDADSAPQSHTSQPERWECTKSVNGKS